MTLLQLMAASLAGIDRFVFHTINPSGSAGFEEARSLFDGDIAGGQEPSPWTSCWIVWSRWDSIGA